jgi:ISXO2-like transposase domain
MQRVTSANVGAVLNEQVEATANLMTDSYPVYNVPGREFATHQTVDHGAGEFARGDAHINTAEGFFSQLKRSLDGTFHHVSAQHLDRYLSEFDFRYTTRKLKDSERTTEAIKRTAGKRLRYYAGKSELAPHLT